jgi:hypothetical protein
VACGLGAGDGAGLHLRAPRADNPGAPSAHAGTDQAQDSDAGARARAASREARRGACTGDSPQDAQHASQSSLPGCGGRTSAPQRRERESPTALAERDAPALGGGGPRVLGRRCRSQGPLRGSLRAGDHHGTEARRAPGAPMGRRGPRARDVARRARPRERGGDVTLSERPRLGAAGAGSTSLPVRSTP